MSSYENAKAAVLANTAALRQWLVADHNAGKTPAQLATEHLLFGKNEKPFGHMTEAVKNLVNALTGFDIKTPEPPEKMNQEPAIRFGYAAWTIQAVNIPDFPMGTTVVVNQFDTANGVTGVLLGNGRIRRKTFPRFYTGAIRPATDEEIEAFFQVSNLDDGPEFHPDMIAEKAFPNMVLEAGRAIREAAA